jgi:flavin reductase (DIM6/NTAB) family NADH-FMN oxidoreductase RutF
MKITERQLRDTLGRFTTGVSIVTAAPYGYEPTGVTINSFTSVSMEPPLILWCLKIDSVVHGVFEATDRFTVNILAENQRELADIYADKTKHRLATDCYVTDDSGIPVLRDSIATFKCMVKARYEEGDHIIIIGEVIDITSVPGDPLVFYNGRYRELKP